MKAAFHVRATRAQCKLFDEKVMACGESGIEGGGAVRTLVIDYGQNMQMPWFGHGQPRETYYYTPLNVSNLGIVDCFNDTLYAHIYHKGEGKKGGNNVASLLIKQLHLFGWIHDNDEEYTSVINELNVIFS